MMHRVTAMLALVAALASTALAAQPTAVERGQYVLRAAGCTGCHTDPDTDGPPLAGGRALDTPFGTFYTPNITPHPDHGIGAWSEREFLDALSRGVGPGGVHYYPAFPYPSYTRMRRGDASDLFAYLHSLEPVARENRPHELSWFVRWRFVNRVWKLLFFEPGGFEEDSARSPEWNRGAYIVRALAHCGECHTPRNLFGASDDSREFAGTEDGPDDAAVPNITQDRDEGIGRWSVGELTDYFSFGLDPEGDVAGGLMAEVIDDGLTHLTGADMKAIAEYLRSVPARR